MKTSQENRQAAVAASEILAQIDGPVALLSLDGRILEFNAASEKLTGIPASEAIGKHIFELAAPDGRQDHTPAPSNGGQAGANGDAPREWSIRAGAHRLIRWTNKPVKAADGATLLLAIGDDGLAQSESTDGLNETKTFLRAVIDASPVAVVTATARGEILTFSRQAERVFGYKEREAVGQNLNILMPEPDHSQHDGYLRRYLATGEARIIGRAREVKGKRRNGEVFPAILHVSEFIDGENIYVAFIDDITERRDTEKKLARTRDELHHAGRVSAMGEIATSIAHELNQPLTAATSLVGAAAITIKKEKSEKAASAAHLLDDAVSEIKRASDLIKNTREFIRKDSAGRGVHDVNATVRHACEIALIGSLAQGVDVEFDLAEDVGMALIDDIQIQQVVVNLVRNALDAMLEAETKKLRVSTRRTLAKVEISISDTGPGVDPKMRQRLFQPFNTTKAQGLGVGLSISKSIIDAHQGEIFVAEDDRPGATFVVRLPGGVSVEADVGK